MSFFTRKKHPQNNGQAPQPPVVVQTQAQVIPPQAQRQIPKEPSYERCAVPRIVLCLSNDMRLHAVGRPRPTLTHLFQRPEWQR